jgi:enolase
MMADPPPTVRRSPSVSSGRLTRVPTIEAIHGMEILDSRGRPTVQATMVLAGGASARAQVPSGASTGGAEARELRDGDRTRYRGLGCRRAVENLTDEIGPVVVGRAFPDQAAFDQLLIDLDGTRDKGRLGANAILAASLAFARAHAAQRGLPLYRHLADVAFLTPPTSLPRPAVNLFSGGKHAGGQVAIQDVLVVPMRATMIDEALAAVAAVYAAASELCGKKYGSRRLVADEGGLAPEFPVAGGDARRRDGGDPPRRFLTRRRGRARRRRGREPLLRGRPLPDRRGA